ncbi:hypothetical protein QVD17_10101 [Tagetes erecta]|uniref:Uncharacterized protein n=1 Tax=Tagetes erecta TaxID=13708 RepID=A0AAD8L542_TARER|nr:hypothetical protein QVD17_10101 [Tagetes erecta]
MRKETECCDVINLYCVNSATVRMAWYMKKSYFGKFIYLYVKKLHVGDMIVGTTSCSQIFNKTKSDMKGNEDISSD